MKKRYAPLVPNAKWHRPGDTEYARELLEAAGISQRKAAEALGIDQRTLRYKLAEASSDGSKRTENLDYAEQFVLEVLADRGPVTEVGEAQAVHEESPAPYLAREQSEDGPSPIWHQIAERKIKKTDVGKLVVGYDKFGALVCGKLVADGFGIVIDAAGTGVGKHQVPISRLERYTLLDQPPSKA